MDKKLPTGFLQWILKAEGGYTNDPDDLGGRTNMGITAKVLSPGLTAGMLCRAWVNFNGTGTVAINAAMNVSSITDEGTGRYWVNFTTAMPDSNYSVAIAGRKYNNTDDANFISTYGNTTRLPTTTRVPVTTAVSGSSPDLRDFSSISVLIFR